ncbi:helix-turn-helix transcriptional regulator [Actinomadura geliboluensis]|uniref:helix-turn-helix transcriptional regulator n=1 Tax=Actinomadura geliboluensis TaxID=882440 RepID=UPI001486EF10|nr:helix-turn-helix transcriptional regulator [Actinomadura geliboluensis]
MIGAGMARTCESVADQPSWLIPVPMDVALQHALVGLAQEALVDYQRLLGGYQRMRDLPSSTSASADPSVCQLAQLITDSDEVGRLTSTLLGSVQREWLTLASHAPTEPMEEIGDIDAAPSAVERGARCRAIYDADSLQEATMRTKLERIAETGIQVRILPRIRMSMGLADEAIALLPLTAAESAGALLVQSSVIVDALGEYFELLWERAIPFGGTGRNSKGLPEIQVKILRLLVQGLPDEAIAERVDVSLTTVRRHIRSLRETLRVQTRFQLGVAAVQQGVVE